MNSGNLLISFAVAVIIGVVGLTSSTLGTLAGHASLVTKPHRHHVNVPSLKRDEPLLLSAEAPCVNTGATVRCST